MEEYRTLRNAYGLRTDDEFLNTSLFTSPFESCYGEWDSENNLYVKMTPEKTLKCSLNNCDLFFNNPYTKKQKLFSFPYQNAKECKEDSLRLYNNWKSNDLESNKLIGNAKHRDKNELSKLSNRKGKYKHESSPIFLKTFIITTIIGILIIIIIIIIPKNKVDLSKKY